MAVFDAAASWNKSHIYNKGNVMGMISSGMVQKAGNKSDIQNKVVSSSGMVQRAGNTSDAQNKSILCQGATPAKRKRVSFAPETPTDETKEDKGNKSGLDISRSGSRVQLASSYLNTSALPPTSVTAQTKFTS